MFKLFEYNWMVRDEWFELFKQSSNEELLRERSGGPGCILYTLFHILDVEYSWICGIQGKPEVVLEYEDYKSLEKLKELSDSWRQEMRPFLEAWTNDFDYEMVTVPWSDDRYAKGEILRHVIAHEIHHMGQLSIWAREIGVKPVSSSVIGRGLFNS